MELTTLVTKYHPKSIDNFIGLNGHKRIIKNYLAHPYPASWLFSGPPGTGKTSMAMFMADSIVRPNAPDVAFCACIGQFHGRECNAENMDKIKQGRGWSWYSFNENTPPKQIPWRVIIVDEADEMTNAAYIDLLGIMPSKEWEHFPLVLIFTCNHVERVDSRGNLTWKLEPRFLSRCRHLKFSTYGMFDDIVAHLKRIWSLEAPGVPEPKIEDIVRESKNNIRDALSALELELLSL